MKHFRKVGIYIGIGVVLAFVCIMMMVVKIERTEPLQKAPSEDKYAETLQSTYHTIRETGGIVWDLEKIIGEEEKETVIKVKESGTYVFGISYASNSHEKSTIALEVSIDGNSIAKDLKAIQLDKIYADSGTIREDGVGNQIAAEQDIYDGCTLVYPVDNESIQNYEIELEQGEHTIRVASVNDALYISTIVLKKAGEMHYQTPKDDAFVYSGDALVWEAEESLWKNSSWLISLADSGSYNVSPADATLKKINYIGGSNWKYPGEIITWQIDIPEDGYYSLGFSYRQSQVVNYSSYRTLLIDGVCPFEEVRGIEFPYNYTWEKMSISNDDEVPYLFYLTKGLHTIGLQVNLGDYFEICERLEKVVTEIGDLNLEITMITGETVDMSRDYDLFIDIPDLEERFKACIEEMEDLEKEIAAVSAGESSSYSLVLRNMVRVIEQMLENKYSAARYKNDYYTNYTSLSVCFSDMQEMPLDIDQLIVSAPDDNDAYAEENWFSGFFKKLKFSLKRFVGSFTNDYNNISGELESEESLTLWVNWGQDQARVLNAMIQTDFSDKYGIDVEVQVTNASVVQAILSGNGPDVVLQQARTEPVNLAMRGALYDLTNFDDYEDVLTNFATDAATPYYYEDGLYALPDTQTFFVMFYREDILEELGVEVPTTWEEFNSATKTILQNKLSVWLPYTQINDSYTVNTGVGGLTLFPTMLLQNDVPLYDADGMKTTLTSSEALGVFEKWTDYYTELNLPVQMDFYNRFRAGTCPLGITSYSTAVALTAEAPELDGLWSMAPIPGTVREDGSVNNVVAGGGTGCSILNISENKEAAWTFLKWWTSADTQRNYSTNVESILGPLGRIMVSNTEALKTLPWTEAELSVILQAREHVKELPEYPGGYQVSRSIDMAFYAVKNDSVKAKDVMTKWAKAADSEIAKKWAQYKQEAMEDAK